MLGAALDGRNGGDIGWREGELFSGADTEEGRSTNTPTPALAADVAIGTAKMATNASSRAIAITFFIIVPSFQFFAFSLLGYL